MQAARKRFALMAGTLLAVLPGIGLAQDAQGSRDLLTPLGEYFLLGGGVTDFTKSAVKDRFAVGGSWDVRVGIGSRAYVGGEVAYVGARRNGDGANPDLLTNGAEGVLRLQVPYAAGSWLIEPFAFGGIGWSHVSLRNAPPGVKDSDDIGVVPFGGGFTVGYGRFLVDARFTYRASFNENLRLAANEDPAKLSQWGVGASIGYEF